MHEELLNGYVHAPKLLIWFDKRWSMYLFSQGLSYILNDIRNPFPDLVKYRTRRTDKRRRRSNKREVRMVQHWGRNGEWLGVNSSIFSSIPMPALFSPPQEYLASELSRPPYT